MDQALREAAAEAWASFNFVAHSSQHTSTVLTAQMYMLNSDRSASDNVP